MLSTVTLIVTNRASASPITGMQLKNGEQNESGRHIVVSKICLKEGDHFVFTDIKIGLSFMLQVTARSTNNSIVYLVAKPLESQIIDVELKNINQQTTGLEITSCFFVRTGNIANRIIYGPNQGINITDFNRFPPTNQATLQIVGNVENCTL